MLSIWKPKSLSSIETLFDEFFRDRDLGNYYQTSFSPDIDIRETEKELWIDAELPGMEKSEVKVTYEEGALKISGEKKYLEEQEGECCHRTERRYGKFMRMIPLQQSYIEDQDIKAEFHNGILHIAIPKKEEVISKDIKVVNIK